MAEMDAFSPRGGARSQVGFARIDNFKGLESEVVVLVDMPSPGQEAALRAAHYVGMSRARALLSIIDVAVSSDEH